MCSDSDLPQRGKQHVTGDTAVNAFKFHAPQEWVYSEPEQNNDYGWDFLVTVTKDGDVTDDFHVQVKGSNSPSYSSDGTFISVTLKVSTTKWLQRKPVPVMIAFCDTGKNQRPVYYAWLDDCLKQLQENTPGWHEYDEVTLRVPADQIMSSEESATISKRVEQLHTAQRARNDVLDVMEGKKESAHFSSVEKPSLEEECFQQLQQARLIEISATPSGNLVQAVSAEEREAADKLDDISRALDDYRRDEARELLQELEEEIEQVSDPLKARYHNNYGVLLRLEQKDSDAVREFDLAVQLDPSEPKYRGNLLGLQLVLSESVRDKHPLPEDWDDKLEALLEDEPDFHSAIMARVYRLCSLGQFGQAENFLRESSLWEEDPVLGRIGVAEIYAYSGQIDDAIEALDEAEQKSEGLLPLDVITLKAHYLLLSAFGAKDAGEAPYWRATAPPHTNLSTLRSALKVFKRAFGRIASLGYPMKYEAPVVNYATALTIVGKLERAEQICDLFLAHTDSAHVRHALASVLLRQENPGKKSKLLQNAKIAYEERVQGPRSYRLYLLAHRLVGNAEDVIHLYHERRQDGFNSQEEEAIAKSCAAVAYWEIGQGSEYERLVSELEDDVVTLSEACEARAVIALKRGRSLEETADIYRCALSRCPENQVLLTNFASRLPPDKAEYALEIIDALEKVKETRLLAVDEYLKLAQAHLTLTDCDISHADRAAEILDEGREIYSECSSLLFECARAYFARGEEKRAQVLLQKYCQLGEQSYQTYQNLAIMATRTGRVEEAIRFLHCGLSKTTKAKEKSQLHAQLFELKRQKESNPKEIMRHAADYGENMVSDPAAVARYIMMFMLCPSVPEAKQDEEYNRWVRRYKQVRKEFFEENPNYHGLRQLKVPEDVSDKERAEQIKVTLGALTLEHQLKAGAFEIGMKSTPWPFVFRAEVLRPPGGLFAFWQQCTRTRTKGYEIWILGAGSNPLDKEHDVAVQASVVCADITALLTLTELDLWGHAREMLDEIILPRDIEDVLVGHIHCPGYTHPYATKLLEWLRDNREFVRFKTRVASERSTHGKKGFRLTDSGVYAPSNPRLSDLLLAGTGESVLMAKELDLPLYCDDSAVRDLALKEHGVRSFSTLSVLRGLRIREELSVADEADLYAQMIAKHYRVVPVTPEHMIDRLVTMCQDSQEQSDSLPTADDIRKDDVLGKLIKELRDDILTLETRIQLTLDWWVEIAKVDSVPQKVLDEAVPTVSFAIAQEARGGIVEGLSEHGPENLESALWAAFLWRSWRWSKKALNRAWSAIKKTAERRSSTQEELNTYIWQRVPRILTRIIEADGSLSADEKLVNWTVLDQALPSQDKACFSRIHARQKPSFKKVTGESQVIDVREYRTSEADDHE